MNENGVSGGARAALAAHSKDASAHGQTPASGVMGDHGHASGGPGTVREGAGHVGEAVREAVGNAREALSGQGGRALDQTAEFIRGQPLAAMAITGAVCLALGMLLSRR